MPTVPFVLFRVIGAWASNVTWWVTVNVGSLENVTVTVPFADAVPSATRPVEVNS